MANPKEKTIELALQGGGAHGAFTWAARRPPSAAAKQPELHRSRKYLVGVARQTVPARPIS